MKKYKFITIAKKENHLLNGKSVYIITNNRSGSDLGAIYYYPKWKVYVFTQASEGVIFNAGCLSDIIDFIENEI